MAILVYVEREMKVMLLLLRCALALRAFQRVTLKVSG